MTWIGLKLSLCLINKALRCEDVWGNGCIDPHFLDLGSSRRWVINFEPRSLYPRYPMCRRLGGTQDRSGPRGEEKILQLIGTLNSDPSLVYLATSCYTGWAIITLWELNVLTTVVIGSSGIVKRNSGGICRLHIQGQKSKQNKDAAQMRYISPEHGGKIFLRNVYIGVHRLSPIWKRVRISPPWPYETQKPT
jgi:hypothetical protein